MPSEEGRIPEGAETLDFGTVLRPVAGGCDEAITLRIARGFRAFHAHAVVANRCGKVNHCPTLRTWDFPLCGRARWRWFGEIHSRACWANSQSHTACFFAVLKWAAAVRSLGLPRLANAWLIALAVGSLAKCATSLSPIPRTSFRGVAAPGSRVSPSAIAPENASTMFV